ncbi:MAG: formylglycine-generating enzyme family protein [Planctomycetota bacterium]|nr:formylglycine-generating enzyme family protein [Planctomycetota bacterium]
MAKIIVVGMLAFLISAFAVAASNNQKSVENTQPARRVKTNTIGMKLVYVEPGTFTMGSPRAEKGRQDSENEHLVTISRGFWIGVFPVTQSQWESMMKSTVLDQRPRGDESPLAGVGPDCPMYYVSWHDSIRFCKELSGREHARYRLPTEAEWEYACRAGTSGPYAGSGILDEMGWYKGNSPRSTSVVGKKAPNQWGLYDMHGNVMQWCSDWSSDKYPNDHVVDPQGPEEGETRIARGGSWFHAAEYARSASRAMIGNPTLKNFCWGFRVVLEEK